MGKALLAGMSDDEIDLLYVGVKLEGRTEHTITTVPALKKELATIRTTGYVVDAEELEIDLCCVGPPTSARTGRS